MGESKKFTFEVPRELRDIMDAHPEVNWTAVFREAIRRQGKAAQIARQILEEEDDPRIAEVAQAVKARVGERFRAARSKPARGRR